MKVLAIIAVLPIYVFLFWLFTPLGYWGGWQKEGLSWWAGPLSSHVFALLLAGFIWGVLMITEGMTK